MNWGDIKRWRASSMEAAIDAVVSGRRGCAYGTEAIQGINNGVTWEGAGATAAREAQDSMLQEAEELMSAVGALLEGVSAAKDGVADVELKVHEAQSRADHYGFTIDDAGTVSDPNPRKLSILDYFTNNTTAMLEAAEREAALQDTADAISAALERASKVDQALIDAFNSVQTAAVSPTERIGDINIGLADLPAGASTEEVAAWWDSMTPTEQAAVLAEHSQKVGEMDGVDGWARDLANRTALNEDLRQDPHTPEARQMAQALGYEKDERGNYVPTMARVSSEAGREVAQLLADEHGWNVSSAVSDSPKQLLLYQEPDPERGIDHFRGAVTKGDVDTAQHVATFVPGMTTTVADSTMINYKQMEMVHKDAQDIATGDVAVVTWLGYDAPGFNSDVTSTDRAREGGDAFNSFVEGVYDSRGGDPNLHMSGIGHSYGSTTISSGLADTRPGVIQDVMLYGSPGMDAEGGWDLNVDDSRRVVTYNEDLLSYLNGATVGLSGMYGSGALGPDPKFDEDFIDVTPSSGAGTLHPIDAHTIYVDRDDARKEIVNVVVGQKHE